MLITLCDPILSERPQKGNPQIKRLHIFLQSVVIIKPYYQVVSEVLRAISDLGAAVTTMVLGGDASAAPPTDNPCVHL